MAFIVLSLLLVIQSSSSLTIQAHKLPSSSLSLASKSIYKPAAVYNESFASTYQLKDGEIITKLHWNNYSAIETRYLHIDLIQLTRNEHEIIQFWLTDGQLIDCEYTNDSKTIEKFHEQFNKINPNIHKDSKSFQMIEKYNNLTKITSLPEHLKRLIDYERYEHECQQLHQKIRQHYQSKIINNNVNDDKNLLRSRRRTRTKRDSLLFPGTKWCGKGSNGKVFEDLGDYSFADRCCRDHDRCKYSIGPFENQYHLFNYRFHYVSHCSCDERFRSCLKVANSGAANLVGKIYFNVVKTKCFMFKMDDMCTDRTWWGNCIETKRRKRAVFREPMEY
ncbi:hypothetical protein DERP_013166 [Dermatophagoides pteronyssinus]|uniref:Phospholipase A2-like central domain-containing protein n=1 Tax=Dermatophagoides pteronyssinus TaxID=6956 RepID=A0ABQ8J398_DERPT|nr:hypothetical protein DERP_013166 [Dermatophagoides pteronyssinus]